MRRRPHRHRAAPVGRDSGRPAAPAGSAGSRGGSGDRGAVTAELAVLLPVVAVLLAAVLVVAACGVTQLRCADAARAGARAASLGEDDAAVAAVARRVGGDGVQVTVRRDGEWVTVTVDARVGPGVGVGSITLRADATARSEP